MLSVQSGDIAWGTQTHKQTNKLWILIQNTQCHQP